jgi:hypothetical protein
MYVACLSQLFCVSITVPNRIANEHSPSKFTAGAHRGRIPYEVLYLQGLAEQILILPSPWSKSTLPLFGPSSIGRSLSRFQTLSNVPEEQGLHRSRVRTGLYFTYSTCDISCISINEGHLQLAKSMLLALSECNAARRASTGLRATATISPPHQPTCHF